MTPFDPVEASKKGVAIRQERAALKRDLASGQRNFLVVFDQAAERTDPVSSGLRVEWFLRALPSVGVTKAQAICEKLGINPRATLGGLRVNQRTLLRRELSAQLAKRRQGESLGNVVVIAGPTAVGKDTVIRRILVDNPQIVMSVSATTRAPRPGEIDGVHYYFVDDARFDEMIARGELLEWAVVHGNHRYGTPIAGIDRQLAEGKSVILEIDVQGARQIRSTLPDALFVFIAPPSFDELARRLESRGTEDAAEQQRRLATAVHELAARDEFDVVVTNDVVDRAATEVVDLVLAHREKQRK